MTHGITSEGRGRRDAGVRAVTVVVAVLALALAVAFNDVRLSLTERVPHEARVEIVRGMRFREIARLLASRGIVSSEREFLLAGWATGTWRVIQAGEYRVTASMPVDTLLGMLRRGDVIRYRVTLPEGATLFEVARLLAAEGLVAADHFVQEAMDRSVVGGLGIEGVSVEGYLFPDTYEFTKGVGPRALMRVMVERFRQVFSRYAVEAAARGLSVHEVVTLASLIEREVALRDEAPLVSAVFHNRLKRGLRLQSDPTAVYDLPDFAGRISRRHVQRATPYNTYHIAGLPLGPIANPGEGALRAAVNPARVGYLFFVARGDGTHVFSTSLRDHDRAVAVYQRGRGTEAPSAP